MLLLSWNVHIHHQSTQDRVHCPSSPDDLGWKIYKAEKISNTHKYKQRRAQTWIRVHTQASARTTNTHTPWNIFLIHIHFIKPFIRHEGKCRKMLSFCACCCWAVSYPNQGLNRIYEPVMKHFMLIVFVYEQINGSRAKRMMMWAHTQHDRIPEEFISCLQVIRGNN